jgi:hypothetical protein
MSGCLISVDVLGSVDQTDFKDLRNLRLECRLSFDGVVLIRPKTFSHKRFFFYSHFKRIRLDLRSYFEILRLNDLVNFFSLLRR